MGGKARILVVDDDDPIRTMLAKVLGRGNVEVDTARDGAEAIERIDADHYDVILLDLMMPRVDGFAVLQHMQASHPEQLDRTIIASAIPPAEIARRFNAPVMKVHAKPFDLQQLMADVQTRIAAG